MTVKNEEAVDLQTSFGPMRTYVYQPNTAGSFAGLILFSEIFQATGPIRRMATWLAGHGYIVAVPEVYHELEAAGTVLPYDQVGADKGNENKYTKELASYDADARAVLDYLKKRPNCTGRLGAMGICLGGHLALRAALNEDVLATTSFYGTDIHSSSLGKGKQDDTMQRLDQIKGELLLIWGRQDPHVPLEGRRRILARLDAVQANYQWLEVNGAHAFLRDEGYRYDPSLAQLCLNWALDLFDRRLAM